MRRPQRPGRQEAAEIQVTPIKQTSFYGRIRKTHRTAPNKVALFASS